MSSETRCEWRYDYDYGDVVRCAKRHGHSGDHDPQLHGFGPFSEWGEGAIPPAGYKEP